MTTTMDPKSGTGKKNPKFSLGGTATDATEKPAATTAPKPSVFTAHAASAEATKNKAKAVQSSLGFGTRKDDPFLQNEEDVPYLERFSQMIFGEKFQVRSRDLIIATTLIVVVLLINTITIYFMNDNGELPQGVNTLPPPAATAEAPAGPSAPAASETAGSAATATAEIAVREAPAESQAEGGTTALEPLSDTELEEGSQTPQPATSGDANALTPPTEALEEDELALPDFLREDAEAPLPSLRPSSEAPIPAAKEAPASKPVSARPRVMSKEEQDLLSIISKH